MGNIPLPINNIYNYIGPGCYFDNPVLFVSLPTVSHVVIVVPLRGRVSMIQGETLDQAGYGGLRRTRTVEVRFQDASVHQTCLCKRTGDVTPEEDPTSLKKAKLKSATREGPVIGPTDVQTRYCGPGTKGNCWSKKSDTVFHPRFHRGRNSSSFQFILMTLPDGPQKKKKLVYGL